MVEAEAEVEVKETRGVNSPHLRWLSEPGIRTRWGRRPKILNRPIGGLRDTLYLEFLPRGNGHWGKWDGTPRS